ncbi:YolD-like family protein [Streptococcus gordonii]|uniref:YolD-like family protein n=1 Tax=Streptococcus gordonii TaxID=1302 RepID=UPI002001AB1E|nr:YolD-like family protein [Streptococcus gordonii]
MTDRSYLPYQSARDFQDRGMAKWAGFFLSEHSTALDKKELDMSQLTQLDRQEINRLLRQAYSQQVPIRITFLNQERLTEITATVFHLDSKQVLLQEGDHYKGLAIHQILSIQASGGADDYSEST